MAIANTPWKTRQGGWSAEPRRLAGCGDAGGRCPVYVEVGAIASRWRLAGRLCGGPSGTRGIWAPAAPAIRAERAAAASKITIRIASRWRRAVLGCGGPCGTREIAAPGAAACRATSMLAVISPRFPDGIVRSAPVSCPAADRVTSRLRPVLPVPGGRRGVRARAPGFSAAGRAGPLGRLRRVAAPSYCPPRSPPCRRRRPAPRDPRHRADGDHVITIGHFSGLRHVYREPPDGVSCPHPFRVRRPAVALGQG
jgi:hypothetical protein